MIYAVDLFFFHVLFLKCGRAVLKDGCRDGKADVAGCKDEYAADETGKSSSGHRNTVPDFDRMASVCSVT